MEFSSVPDRTPTHRTENAYLQTITPCSECNVLGEQNHQQRERLLDGATERTYELHRRTVEVLRKRYVHFNRWYREMLSLDSSQEVFTHTLQPSGHHQN